MFFTLTLLAGAAAYQPATLPRHRDASSLSNLQMMAKKPKTDPRVWLPKRSSPYAREVDVALQLVSRASAAVGKASLEVANIAAQALVSDGIGSEFSDDTVMATQSAATLKAVDAGATLELINEIGATTPCVNEFDPPYPDAVKATALTEADLGALLDKGNGGNLGPRTWVLAPITEAVQPAVSLTLLESGLPVVCAVALPNLPRNSMSGEKLLRMTVSFDGQSGAVRPDDGTILWAEENKGAYERAIGGTHGTDIPLRADRSLIGKRNIAAGQVNAVQDFAATTRCQVSAQPRAAALASDLGMPADVLSADGPFAYGLVARGEAMTYFDLPETAADFDASISAHAAGTLLVAESGGMVTDTAGNALDFSQCRDGGKLPSHVVGVITTNKDLHPDVLRQCGQNVASAAAK